MIRGLKKKLLIGLLSAAVVGTSLAPSVPLVGSFAQEVKATEATNKYEYTAVPVSAVPATYKWPDGKYYTVTPGAAFDLSSNAEDTAEVYKEKDGKYTKVTLTAGTAENANKWMDGDALATDTYYKITATKYTGTPTSELATVDVYEKTSDGSSYTKTKLNAEVDTYKWSVDYVPGKYFMPLEGNTINDGNAVDAKAKFAENPSGTFTVYTRKSAVKDQASVNIIDKKEDSDVKVGNATISQPNKPSATVTVSGESGASTLVATNVKTVLDIVLSEIPKGKKVTKVEAIVKKDGSVDEKITGSVSGVNVSFDLGKITKDVIVTIVATVEDAKITPTLKTNLNGASAAFDGETNVKQVGGELTVVVTPDEAKNLNTLIGKIDIKSQNSSDDIEVTGPTKESGKLYYKIKGTFADENPVIVVSGGLRNDKEIIEGKDYAKVVADSNVSVDPSKILEEYKNLDDTDEDKNSAVVVTTKTSPEAATVFNNIIANEQIKNENIEVALNVNVTVKAGQTDDAETQANGEIAKNDVKKFNNPITIKVKLPVEARNKGGYFVLRSHDGGIQRLETSLKDGEGIKVDGDDLYIYTKELSDFTVLYDKSLSSDTPAPEPNPGEDDPAKEDDNNKGTITPANGTTATTNTAKAATSTKAAKVTTSTKKSTKTSSPKTADYAVNSLLALLTGAAGLFGITLVNKKRKEDEE
ncbi:hypothetical protein [Lachnobacterium bovis]|uniref:hypothetical protein n=1 Tax=Lachnobacterium bovis TaxID=140626 RepID=UPI00048CBE6B|nr:hypothetical protein [Lachnobacterium bovis]